MSNGVKISYAAYERKFKEYQSNGYLLPNAKKLSLNQYTLQYNKVRTAYYVRDKKGNLIKISNVPLADQVIAGQSKIDLEQSKKQAMDFKKWTTQNLGRIKKTMKSQNFKATDYYNFVYGPSKNAHAFSYRNINGLNELSFTVDSSFRPNNNNRYTLYFDNNVDSIRDALRTLPKDVMYSLLISLGILTSQEADNYEGY